MGTIEKEVQEKFKIVLAAIWTRSNFLKFLLPRSSMFTKKENKRSNTLALRLTTAVRIILVNFAQMLLRIKFETSALNAPKITLKTTRSMISHTHTASIPRVLNFNSFRLQIPVFELHAILRQVHWMTTDCRFWVTGYYETCPLDDSKWPCTCTLSGQKYPIYVLLEAHKSRTWLRLAISKISAVFYFLIEHN